MKKRQSAVQQFCTFLSFSNASSAKQVWRVELKLERTIKEQLQQHSGKTAEQWARYFLEVLREEESSERLTDCCSARKYLSAYLQEACYHAAQKTQKQFHSIRCRYSLADLFQIGNLLANQPVKLFRSFDLEYQHTQLDNYARTAIFRFIKNTIYNQDIEAKREKFSDYGLLRDLSHKELKEALAFRGFSTNQIELYCLARQCFEAVYQPQTCSDSRSLAAPNQEALVQMSACYNQQRINLSSPTGQVDAQKIQMMLSTCIQSARDYRSKRVVTLENNDRISDPVPTPWEKMIQAEERQQIESLISGVFTTMPEVDQTLLKLWRGLNLTQTEIAIVLQHKHPELQKQYQVARQLGKSNRSFLKELMQRCLNHHLGDQVPCSADPARTELIQALLDECLKAHCKRLIYAELEHLSQQPLIDQQDFIQASTAHLEATLNLPPKSLKLVTQKIIDTIVEWERSTTRRLRID